MLQNSQAKASLTQEQKQAIVDVLKKRGVPAACPMCRQNNWTVGDGYLAPIIQPDLHAMALGGQSIPSALLVCTNCGFMSQHALGILGLLPSLPVEEEDGVEPTKDSRQVS